MDAIRIDIAGDRQVGLRFDEFPDALYQDLQEEVGSLSQELYGRVVWSTPSLTGTLRSEERLRLFTDPDRITGYVDIEGGDGSNEYAKAGALEYGSRGRATKVATHDMKLDHFWSRKLAEPIDVVTQYLDGRIPNITEERFERGPLEAMQPEILSRLNAVVARATAEANA